MISKPTSLFFCLLLLAGCSATLREPAPLPKPEVNLTSSEIHCQTDKLAKVNKLSAEMQPIQWKIVNSDGITYFALTSAGYRSLSVNVQTVQKALLILQEVVTFYQECTKPPISNE